jgi:hypothetical protein
MARPYARLGALDSQGQFDFAACERRRQGRGSSGGTPYYAPTSNISDECVLEHEILLSRKDTSMDGQRDAIVFSSLNGMGAHEGVTPAMDDEEARLVLRDAHSYAGVAVTDFIRQSGAYAPEEGARFTVTHGGINTLHAAATSLKTGDLIQVQFPTKLTSRSMKRRRGASNHKVTAYAARYTPYSTGRTAVTAVRAMVAPDGQQKLGSYDKWNVFAQQVTTSYLAAAVQFHELVTTSDLASQTAENMLQSLGGTGRAPKTKAAKLLRAQFLNKCMGLSAVGSKTSEYERVVNGHLERAVGAFAVAAEDERRWVIGKCVQGAKEGGYATVALGVQ